MKKVLMSFICGVSFVSSAWAAVLPETIDKFLNCLPDTRTSKTEFFGATMDVEQIIGPTKDNKCHLLYKVNMPMGTNETECFFTPKQLALFRYARDVAGDKEYILKVESKESEFDENGVMVYSMGYTQKGDLYSLLWSSYYNNKEVCSNNYVERDVKAEIEKALKTCDPYVNEVAMFGMENSISIAPKENKCEVKYLFKQPTMVVNKDEIKGETFSAVCQLSEEQRLQVIENDENISYQVEGIASGEMTVSLNIPSAYLLDKNICRLSHPIKKKESR